jgi:uncharacterized protein Smg (DUF494 family)
MKEFTLVEIRKEECMSTKFLLGLMGKETTEKWLEVSRKLVSFNKTTAVPVYAYSATSCLYIFFEGECTKELNSLRFFLTGVVRNVFERDTEVTISHRILTVDDSVLFLKDLSAICWNIYDLTYREYEKKPSKMNSFTGGALNLLNNDSPIRWNGNSLFPILNEFVSVAVCLD